MSKKIRSSDRGHSVQLDPVRRLLKILAEAGCRNIEEDADGDVSFGIQGVPYYVVLDEDDPEFAKVLTAGFYVRDPRILRTEVLEACNRASHSIKCVKIVLETGNDGTDRASASVDLMFDPTQGPSTRQIERALEAIPVAMREVYLALSLPEGSDCRETIKVPADLALRH